MATQRTRRRFLRTLGTGAVVATAGCIGAGGGETTTAGEGGTDTTTTDPGSATIFHAGSLAAPFEAAEPRFEEQTGIEVAREAKGSVASTRKITTAPHRAADVLGVSDYRLIRDMVLPEYGSWYTIFATNAMTIAYTEDSAYADEFGPDTWYDVIARDDVAVAHSDPAVDPNGYRSVMSMQLGAIPFEGETLYSEDHARTMIENNEVPASTESGLIGQLHSGKLDYAWEYQSAGASHDVETVQLQPAVDLSKATSAYAEHYGKASVTAGGNTYEGAPIAYGMTVPSTAEAPANGARWIEFMTNGDGKQVMRDAGFQPLETPVVPAHAEDAVPDELMEHMSAKAALGPLEL
ncbi:MAG: substrate-binding domain-containing protein [Halanaeroarchaeum sp.]